MGNTLLSHVVFLAPFVRWMAPLPAWTAWNSSEIRTVDMQVLLWSTQVSLEWNYTVPNGQDIVQTVFSIDDGIIVDDIGVVYHHGNGSISTTVFDKNDYRARFSISTTKMATLIISEVTERERATFQCKLVTASSGEWAYKIRLNSPTGKNRLN